jgi:hypothetical protein
MCGIDGIWCSPQEKEITDNSLIIISGYWASQESIESINAPHKIFLVSVNDTVQLNTEELNISAFRLSQIVLKPERKLIIGNEYHIYTEALSKRITKWDRKTRKEIPTSWIVNRVSDTITPTWEKVPKRIESLFMQYGCGPEILNYYAFKTKKQSSHIVIKTQVIQQKTNIIKTFIIEPVNNDTIYIGQEMCAGEFTYDVKTRYRIRFQILDLSGNKSKWTPWSKLNNPIYSTRKTRRIYKRSKKMANKA